MLWMDTPPFLWGSSHLKICFGLLIKRVVKIDETSYDDWPKENICQLSSNKRYNIHAVAELGQAQLKLRLDFTLFKILHDKFKKLIL